MTTGLDRLTPEQEALLPVVRDEWLAHGLCTEPADRADAEAGVAHAYETAGLAPPSIVVWLGRGGAVSDHPGPRGGEFIVGPGECPYACDHCRPDLWHRCQLRAGHDGYHSCTEVW